MAQYIEYYESQIGGGIDRVYVGAANQRGHGIGSFLGGLFRRAIPLLKRGARVLGKEVLRSGMNFMSDLDSDVPWKQAFQTRASETGQNLKRKAQDGIEKIMKGEGYKLRYGGGLGQSGLALPPMLSIPATRSKLPRRRKAPKKPKKRKTTKSTPKKKRKKTASTKGSSKKGRKKKCCRKRPVTDIFGGL